MFEVERQFGGKSFADCVLLFASGIGYPGTVYWGTMALCRRQRMASMIPTDRVGVYMPIQNWTLKFLCPARNHQELYKDLEICVLRHHFAGGAKEAPSAEALFIIIKFHPILTRPDQTKGIPTEETQHEELDTS
eukprot:gene21156-biopygen1775